MPEESDMTHAAAGARPQRTWILWALVSVVITMILVLAGFAFAGMFTAVRDEMVPFFHGLAWIVPVGVDVGILALTASGLLLEWLLMPMPALRWVAMTFMGISVWLNVAAADGSIKGSVGHAALPVLFIACVEAVRHAVRRTAGMAAGTVRDGIPLARWLLAPMPTFLMFRRMVLQRVYSYPAAVTTELRRRHDMAALKAHFGRAWRRNAPGDLVWSLRKGIALDGAHDYVRRLTMSAPAVPARRAAGSAGASMSPAEASPPASAGGASPASATAAVPQKRTGRSEAVRESEAAPEAAPFPVEAKQQGSSRAPASPANVTTLSARSNEAIAAEAREAEASEGISLKTRDIQARFRVSPTRACKILRLLRDGESEAATGSGAVR